ncbi:XapX domain-containing protein [Halomarina pelagica]|uniref:XapX domain-containing protein n=1 Tax=Halomarina pelagica TaxID=2961599 RepID=UPI0020C417CA|nr:DUF1427 family protein [Halomarina sp. BND7]
MNAAVVALAFVAGLATGALFKFLQVPIPAPPTLSGVVGILGIYAGYLLVEWLGVGVDLLDALGL